MSFLFSSGLFVPPSGVMRLTFDDSDTSGGTAFDVWNDNDGTINGATTGVTGANQTYNTNEAYSFDGVDDNVAVGDIYDAATNSFSFACWVNVDSYDANQTVFSNEESTVNFQHILRAESDGNIYFYHNTSGGLDSVSVTGPTAGTWAFVFAFYDQSTDTIGINLDNGTRTTAATSVAEVATVDNWDIGLQTNDDIEYWLGDLDDIRVYNKVLTTTEESDLYNTGSI